MQTISLPAEQHVNRRARGCTARDGGAEGGTQLTSSSITWDFAALLVCSVLPRPDSGSPTIMCPQCCLSSRSVLKPIHAGAVSKSDRRTTIGRRKHWVCPPRHLPLCSSLSVMPLAVLAWNLSHHVCAATKLATLNTLARRSCICTAELVRSKQSCQIHPTDWRGRHRSLRLGPAS